MPTARELLEQADALMRRNRAGAGGEEVARPTVPANPPTFSPTSGPTFTPRTIQREPIAPSVARTSLPVDPTESPVFPAPSDEQPVPAVLPAAEAEPHPPEPEPEFPLLTDAVDEAKPAAQPLDDLGDDVPLLTDAVEEIDVGIVDEAGRGEPSLWELTARGETSVLGPAPDSVVVVPPPDALPPAVPQVPLQGRDPLGLDRPPPGYAPQNEGEAPPRLPPAALEETQATQVDEPQPILSGSFAERSPEDAEEAAVATEARGIGSPSAAEQREASASAEAEPSGSPVEAATPVFSPSLPRVSELDQERIREIAEEIGMQVLQRIDIFTDTTLRAQLGERLRPVVDRAAADLVAAINEHVGELLRAYISEAIEREIESWKSR